MLMPEMKKVAYDPTRYLSVETVDDAAYIILCPTEGMTVKQRWDNETPALMRLMEPYIHRGDTVLDYGCGIGRLAKPLITKMDCMVVGVDISPNMRALAASCVASPRFGAIDPMLLSALRPGQFDAAISVWALQHCLDLASSINQIRLALKPDGYLFVVNNVGRCLPVEGGEWADDGLDLNAMLRDSGFTRHGGGHLDHDIAPGWMHDGTFWAVYKRL